MIRLIDLLPGAHVESPLTEVPVAQTLGDLPGLNSTVVWGAYFGRSEASFAMTGDCGVRGDAEKGEVLGCGREGSARADLAIEPNSSYRIRLDARRSRALGYDVSVTELLEDQALRIFHFPDFRSRWQPFELWIHSTSQSTGLQIALEPMHGQAQVWLDNVVVERLDLTPVQQLSLLKGRNNRSSGAPQSGLAKRGRLLPLDDPEDLESPRAANYAVRDAIFAPTPTDITYSVTLPKGEPRLSLAYGFAEEARPGDSARVQVVAFVEDGLGQGQVLLDEKLEIGPSGEGWVWHERQIPLDPLAGRELQLTLRTRAADSDQAAYVLWGNPEIYTPRRPGEPNVILIAVDTLRADRLSCYGHSVNTSPAIDGLAADGSLFEQAIASANWTKPSFTALFTGRGVLGLGSPMARIPEPSIAESLAAGGMATRAILYKAALYDGGFDRGFDVFLNAPRYRIRAEENLEVALKFLESNGDRRFFLFLHFNDPHQPFCQPPAELAPELSARLAGYGLALPIQVSDRHVQSVDPSHPMRNFEQRAGCSACREADGTLKSDVRELSAELYDDAIRYLDRNVGRFLDELKRRGLYDESVVVFVSDHGEALWDHDGQYGHAGENLHDELIRVPLIIKPMAGSRWRRGSRVEEQVRLIDVSPTLLQLAGERLPAIEGEGRSLLSTLLAETLDQDSSLGELPAFSVGQSTTTLAMRLGAFKYIRRLESGGDLVERLYDLESDPGETIDVSDRHPEVLSRMRSAVLALPEPAEKAGETPARPVDARQQEALRALGYIE